MLDESSNLKPALSTSLGRHRSIWDLRADGWIGLVDDLGRLLNLAPSTACGEHSTASTKPA